MRTLTFVVSAFALILADPALAAAPPIGNPVSVPAVAPMLSASFSAQPATFTGACPATIKFTGTITGPARQSVGFYFTRTIKGVAASSMPTSASLDDTGKLSVADSMSIDGAHAGSGSDELDLVSSTVKATANFSVTCTATSELPLFGPLVHPIKAHIFVPEGSGVYYYPYPQYIDVNKCGGFPPQAFWQNWMRGELKAAFTGEKAYSQEKDAYNPDPTKIGFSPEVPDVFCIKYIFIVGHYTDQPGNAQAFVVTGRHINGGPMLCVTNESGMGHPAGEPGISNAGGPIFTPLACALLPPSPTINPSQYQRAVPH